MLGGTPFATRAVAIIRFSRISGGEVITVKRPLSIARASVAKAGPHLMVEYATVEG
jgi:hypothetical protein